MKQSIKCLQFIIKLCLLNIYGTHNLLSFMRTYSKKVKTSYDRFISQHDFKCFNKISRKKKRHQSPLLKKKKKNIKMNFIKSSVSVRLIF